MTQRPNASRETPRTERGVEGSPYLFIVGCARSGTTLLHRIVDAQPLVAITPEMHWVSDRLQANGTDGETPVTPEAVSELADPRRFSHFELDRGDFEGLLGPDETVSYREFLGRLFGLYGRARGKPIVGNKTPAYVRHLPELHELWPEARFVHIVRDGRDVSLSAVNWDRSSKLAERLVTWKEDPMTTAALWWEDMVRRGREVGEDLGPGLYYELRYEALIEAPRTECERLCGFLGLPYDDAMLNFHEGKTKANQRGLSAKKAWLPVTSGLRDWRGQMSDRDAERFEAAAGDLLQELGYERAFPNPGPEAREHASKIRAALAQRGGL